MEDTAEAVVVEVFTAAEVVAEVFTEAVAEPTSPAEVEVEDITALQAHELTVVALIAAGCPLRHTVVLPPTADRTERVRD